MAARPTPPADASRRRRPPSQPGCGDHDTDDRHRPDDTGEDPALAISHLLDLTSQPFLSLLFIAIDLVILYGVTVRWQVAKTGMGD